MGIFSALTNMLMQLGFHAAKNVSIALQTGESHRLVLPIVNIGPLSTLSTVDALYDLLKVNGDLYTKITTVKNTLASGGVIYNWVSWLFTYLDTNGDGYLTIQDIKNSDSIDKIDEVYSKLTTLLNISTAKLQHLANILNSPIDALKTNIYRLVEYFINTYFEVDSS